MGNIKKKMKITERIDNWFIEELVAPLEPNQIMPFHHFMLYCLWFIPRNFIGKWYFRLLVRGVCAIKGCEEHFSCGGYLPDDVCEWYCKRCGAEGINHVTYSYELFYSDTPLRNLIEALKGK